MHFFIQSFLSFLKTLLISSHPILWLYHLFLDSLNTLHVNLFVILTPHVPPNHSQVILNYTMYHVITVIRLVNCGTSKISSRDTSIRQWPVCGCSACNSWRSIFIFWTRSRLYFGNGESLSATHRSSPLCWFWLAGWASMDDSAETEWSDEDGGGGCPMTAPSVVTTAAWLESRLQVHRQFTSSGKYAPWKLFVLTVAT